MNETKVSRKPVATMYILVDAMDAEVSVHLSMDDVKKFLIRNYQEFPSLYEVEHYSDRVYTRNICIPDGWAYSPELFRYKAIVDISHETLEGTEISKNVEIIANDCENVDDVKAALEYLIPKSFKSGSIVHVHNISQVRGE